MSEPRNPDPDEARPAHAWEEGPALREFFLLHTPAFAATALRELGRHMYDSLLEGELPETDEPWVRSRARALARDLRFRAQVLASLGEARVEAGLTPEELALPLKAESWARELSELVRTIEGSLGETGEER